MANVSPRAAGRRISHAVRVLWNYETKDDLLEQMRSMAEAINKIFNIGASNALGEVTLTSNSATTTLKDARIGSKTKLFFNPTSANAKTEGQPNYTARGNGQCTLNHANNAQTDRTYDYHLMN